MSQLTKKLILLIGLLTYSSVGWSDTYKMKCDYGIKSEFVKSRPNFKYFKLDTNKSSTSEELLMTKDDGLWGGLCDVDFQQCEKRDGSVLREMKSIDFDGNPIFSRQIFDFELLHVRSQTFSRDRSKVLSSITIQCERIE